MDNKLHADMWFPSILWSTMLEDIDNKALVEYANQLRSQDSDGQHHSNRTGYHSNYIENKNFAKRRARLPRDARTPFPASFRSA